VLDVSDHARAVTLARACEQALAVARPALLTMAGAVDAWGAVDASGQYACAARDLDGALVTLIGLLPQTGYTAKIRMGVDFVASVAQSNCSAVDAGSEG
jgi:hypothetical protein